ncbi:MAG TPA: TadE/TadG family type IV pilus assembly protein, partial [Steroidobacteraceae bacterium]
HAPHSEGGTAIIEFTIALPVLLLMLVATAEIGRMLSQYNTLNKAVRDGARYLATNALAGTTGVVSITPAVQTATVNLVVNGNIAGSGAALLPSLAAGNVTVAGLANGYVSVSAAYTYVPMMGANLPTFGVTAPINTSVTLNASVVMRPL